LEKPTVSTTFLFSKLYRWLGPGTSAFSMINPLQSPTDTSYWEPSYLELSTWNHELSIHQTAFTDLLGPKGDQYFFTHLLCYLHSPSYASCLHCPFDRTTLLRTTGSHCFPFLHITYHFPWLVYSSTLKMEATGSFECWQHFLKVPSPKINISLIREISCIFHLLRMVTMKNCEFWYSITWIFTVTHSIKMYMKNAL
jgi:hypothetical protein